MASRINTSIRKVLIGLLFPALLLANLPAATVLAQREAVLTGGLPPAGPPTKNAENALPSLHLPQAETRPFALASAGNWSTLATGLNDTVSAIAASDTTLYAAGRFTHAGTCTSGCNYIAKWDGKSWSPLGSGTDGPVSVIAVSSNIVYAAGNFTTAGSCKTGCSHIAKWDGSQWSALGTGIADPVLAIDIADNVVYAGGHFTSAGSCITGCNNIANWDGKKWSALGTGVTRPDAASNQPVGMTSTSAIYGWPYIDVILVHNQDLYAGGYFSIAGTCTSGCNNIARWDGKKWSALGTGVAGLGSSVNAIAVNGTDVYAGGSFSSAGSCTKNCGNIARWDGHTWSSLGTGISGADFPAVSSIITSDSIYTLGSFDWAGACTNGCSHSARWDGKNWSPLGFGPKDAITAIASSNSRIYLAGTFPKPGNACPSGVTGGGIMSLPPCVVKSEWSIISLK